MLKVNNVTFDYKKQPKLFSRFSLRIEEGKIYGLLGKNGVGKSSLLYLITGLLIPREGEVLYKGKNVAKRLPTTLCDIFLVSEEFDLPHIKLEKFIELNSPFYPRFSYEQMQRYLECFDMARDLNLGSLSLGQKKKVYMSFALATNTSLLVMDEPTNGLDIQGKSQFRKFMALGMNDQKTIIISTHQVADVDKMLDHVVILDHNEIMVDCNVATITDKVAFVYESNGDEKENVLYSQPTVAGNSAMIENIKGEETPLNLELLYNGLLENKSVIKDLLTKQ